MTVATTYFSVKNSDPTNNTVIVQNTDGTTALGIGTNTPAYTLDLVTGTMRVGGALTLGSTLGLANTFTMTAPNQTTPVFEIDSAAGNVLITIRPTIPETPTAAQNSLYLAGQQPLTMTASVDAYVGHIRGWGQGSSTAAGQSALRVHFPAATDSPFLTNYTGSKLAAAINAQTDSTSTGASPITSFVGNAALIGYAVGTTAGFNYGAFGRAANSTVANFGVIGQATLATANVWNVGVLGVARNTGSSGISNSGYFWVGAVDPTNPSISSCVLLDVGSSAVPMLVGYNAGATRFQMDSKGNVAMTPAVTAAGATAFSLTPAAATNVTAEVIDFSIPAHTITITGALATQRFVNYAQPTITAGSALAVTATTTVSIAGPPIAAGSATLTAPNNSSLWVAQAIATVAGGSLSAAIAIGATASVPTAGIYWGSGAPSITAPQGSLYIRTDGSSTSTRLYVNTTGSTTWTNVTTAA